MTTITNDPEAVLRAANLQSWRHSLPPKLGIDQFRTTLPLMVTADDRRPLLLVREIDRTNLEAIDAIRADLAFHTPYFTFDALESPPDVYRDVSEAVASVAGDGTARLDRRMSVSLHTELRGALDLPYEPVDAQAAGQPGEFNHYLVPRTVAPRAAAPGRELAIQASRGYVENLGCGRAIEPWLSAPLGDRFASLDALMTAHGIDALLACTPLNLQELTGLPALFFSDGDVVVYTRGAPSVHVLSPRELPWLGLPEVEAATRVAVTTLTKGGTLGFEELNLPQAAFDAFGLAAADAVPVSRVLRRWRELRSWEDLAFYVIGTQVTLAGIQAALSLVEEALAARDSLTELDAYDRYRDGVQSEIRRLDLPIRVRTYFTHTHAGNRSGIPARATLHPLLPLTSLKIDAGLEIYDETGSHRATSDVTRSVVGTPEARAVYDLLDRALVEAAIPACRPGRTGAEVFEAGVDFLEPHHAELVAAEFCPPTRGARLSELFDRDIGHLIGKQEPATTVFAKGNTARLAAGMVAAAEMQWPYRDWCLGVEDVFLVTEHEPINLTRAEKE